MYIFIGNIPESISVRDILPYKFFGILNGTLLPCGIGIGVITVVLNTFSIFECIMNSLPLSMVIVSTFSCMAKGGL